MKYLYNVHYNVLLGAPDYWKMVGQLDTIGGKSIMPSTPVAFNEKEMTFTTRSGSVYKVMSFNDYTKEEFIKQINEDIANKGYSAC